MGVEQFHLQPETSVVYNSASGNPQKRKANKYAEAFADLWPFGSVHLYEFADILSQPQLLIDTNVVGFGGDGTHGTIAKLNRHHNPEHWYLPLDTGTFGYIAKSCGFARWAWEDPETYGKKIVRYFRENIITQELTSPGQVVYGDTTKEIFMWSVNKGIYIDSLILFENLKSNTAKTSRIFQSLSHYGHKVGQAQQFEVSIGANYFQTIDGHVIKHPYKNALTVRLPFENKDVVCLVHPKPLMILYDLLRISCGIKPTGVGISVHPAEEGETVVFYDTSSKAQPVGIDYELSSRILPVTVYSNTGDLAHPFRILKKS